MTAQLKNLIKDDYRQGCSLSFLSKSYGYPEDVIKRVVNPKTQVFTSAIISTKKTKNIEQEQSDKLIDTMLKSFPGSRLSIRSKIKSPKMIEAGRKAYITRMKNKGITVEEIKSNLSEAPITKTKTWDDIYQEYKMRNTGINPGKDFLFFKDWLIQNYQVPELR